MRVGLRHLGLLALVLVFGGGARAAEEIKIGMLYPLSGVYASGGQQGVQGATLAFEEAGSQVGGRKLVILTEDDEAKPDVALTKAKKLVENDRVHVLMGIIWSPNALALRGYVHERKMPIVLSEAAPRQLTQEAGSPYIFRTGFASGQLTYPFGTYACGKLAYRKVVIITFDSVFGRDESNFFETGCKQSGGAVLEKIFAPVETADFAPYFARIQQANPDAVLGIWGGAAALRFLKQYGEFGMKKYPLLGIGNLTEESVINAVGPAALGVVSYYNYSPAIDSADNRRFVEAYRKRFGAEPGLFSLGGYLAARAIVEAAKATRGDLSDTGRFLTALKAVQFDAPSGRFRFDAHQNSVINIYIRKVQAGQRGGQLVNMPVDVIRDIEQYWPKGKPAK